MGVRQMAYQALYRRWRPRTFEQVLGQTATVRTLRQQVATGRIAHAYLFCGCRGTGKTTMAKLMSRAINCTDPQNGDPCGKCPACLNIQSERSMDVVEMDAASNNSVDNIRELLEQVAYPPQYGRYKVYIIDEVHMLSASAFNALLKTLEEPPAHVVFILATTEPQKLPATILSRVQRYDFGRIPSQLMVARMREALEDMGLAAEDEALSMVARAAEGAMRDAFSILDMCVAGAQDGVITAAQTRELLGASDRDFLFDFASLLAARDMGGLMRQVDGLMRAGREPSVFLRELGAHVRALTIVQAVTGDAASLLDVTAEDEARYREQSALFSRQRLLRMLELFVNAQSGMRFASSPRIALESAVLRACEEPAGDDASALLERVSELEATLKRLEAQGPAPKPAAPKAAASKTAAPKAAAPVPPKPPQASADAQSVWKAALDILKKSDPSLFGLLVRETFLGQSEGVYRVSIPPEKKEFSYLRLTQPARRERVAAALSEAAGRPVDFEPVLAQDARERRLDQRRDEAQRSLIDTFGRDLVQIDEEDEP